MAARPHSAPAARGVGGAAPPPAAAVRREGGRGKGQAPQPAVQQRLTVLLGRPHGVAAVPRPLMNPACTEAEQWWRFAPEHVTAVIRVTLADEDRAPGLGHA